MSMLKIANRIKHSVLTEAKADTQRLIDFAGNDLAQRFILVKSKLKAPENDLYYWIKNKTVDELEAAVAEAEATRSKRSIARDIADSGAELIDESKHWKVYRITTYEASQKYGRDTQWCITGIRDYGDKYWRQYTDKGIEFYFLITKGAYNPRGIDSKYAIAAYPGNTIEIYNQQDEQVPWDDIPYVDEINIPGIDLEEMDHSVAYYCDDCGCEIYDEEDALLGPNGEIYCEDCFGDHCYLCDACGSVIYADDVWLTADDMAICYSCYHGDDFFTCDECNGTYEGRPGNGWCYEMEDGRKLCGDCHGKESNTEVEESYSVIDDFKAYEKLW